MRILVSGASGLIGSALSSRLAAAGHAVVSLRRGASSGTGDAQTVYWDPEGDQLDPAKLLGYDAVVHLAGENIAKGRWTAEKKHRIRRSRVHSTQLLSTALAELARSSGSATGGPSAATVAAEHASPPAAVPRCFLSASAVGIYGDRGDEVLDEDSPPGQGFLAEVCQQWEAATAPAAQSGVRVVCLRFGVVLARHGGALATMLKLFRWGLGGRLGSGRQYVSWITLEDAIGAILHLLENQSLHGPVNVVAPRPVTNRQFTAALATALRRPAILPVPAIALRIMLGEMANQLLLASARAVPRRLAESGYRLADPELLPALQRILSESPPH